MSNYASKSPRNKGSLLENRDKIVEQIKMEEFQRTVDRLFELYDINHDGYLDESEVRRILADAKGKANVTEDDVQTILKLGKEHSQHRVTKSELYHLYPSWQRCTSAH